MKTANDSRMERDHFLGLLSSDPLVRDRFAQEYRLITLKAVRAAGRRFRASEADIEDAVGEVFVALLKEGGRVVQGFRGESAFSTWLMVIAHRIAVKEFARRIRHERAMLECRPKRPHDHPDTDILLLLAQLSDRDRRVLILFHIEEADYKEISVKLCIPSAQVGMVLLRARKALAQILQKSWEGG